MANEFVARKGIISLDSIQVTGSISATGGITISGSISSASLATTALTASSADNFLVRQNLTASSALFTGSITAQTLVIQTVTSSIVYSSGSNIFGNQLTDTQRFTGSMFITGSNSIFNSSFVGINCSGINNRTFVVRNTGGRGIAAEFIANDASSSIYIIPSGSGGANLISSNYVAGASYRPLTLSGRECVTDFVLCNGSVGIGTISPVKTLEVRGTLAISNSPTSYWYMDRDDSDGRFKILDDANSEKFTITTGGNVGIGETSPYVKLQISSPYLKTSATQCALMFVGTCDGANAWGLRVKPVGASAIANRYVEFQTTEINVADGGSIVFQNGGGCVGIGTSSPQTSLHIIKALGNDVIAIGESGTNTRFAIGQEASYTGNYINSRNIDLKLQVYCAGGSGGNIYFQTGTDGTGAVTTKMFLCSSGKLGIGTTSLSTEANLFLGAQGTSEGGQLVLQKGTSYNCATHLDNYQNQFRIVSGTDTVSSTVDFSVAHTNGQAFVRGNLLLNATTISNSTNTFGASANGAYQYFSGNLANGEKFGSTAGTYIQGFYLISWVSASGRGYAIFATVSPAANAGTALISSGGWATVSATYNAASAISLAFDGSTRGPILSNNTGVTTTFYAYVFGGV
jgi:hypothetical protein